MVNKAGGKLEMCNKCHKYVYGLNDAGKCKVCNPVKVTNKESLMKLFDDAIELNDKNVHVMLNAFNKVGDKEYDEIILLPRESWEFKKEYYKNAFDDDLVLKSDGSIKIYAGSIISDITFEDIKRTEVFLDFVVKIDWSRKGSDLNVN